MKIEMRDPKRIKPYPANPRVNEEAIAPVADAIRTFGFRQPIVVDADGVIIVGHVRHQAALQLKLKTVPVHVARDLSAEKIKAYRIADNRLGEISQWNYDLLGVELKDLQSQELDLTLLGWDPKEIERMLAPLDGRPLPADAAGQVVDGTAAANVAMTECPKCGHQFPK